MRSTSGENFNTGGGGKQQLPRAGGSNAAGGSRGGGGSAMKKTPSPKATVQRGRVQESAKVSADTATLSPYCGTV